MKTNAEVLETDHGVRRTLARCMLIMHSDHDEECDCPPGGLDARKFVMR